MGILKKIFGKKEEVATGYEIVEHRVPCSLEYRTSIGSIMPGNYRTDSGKQEEMQRDVVELVRESLEAGILDAQSNLAIYSRVIEKRRELADIEVKQQQMQLENTIADLERAAEQHLLLYQREQEKLEAIMDEINGRKRASESERGIG